jgi:hypothetical protein
MALEIISGLGGVGAIAAFIWFVSRQIVKHELSKNLEEYKTKLNIETHKEIENLKSKNEIYLAEYREKVARLSEKRIQAIDDVSIKLIELWGAIEGATLLLRPVSDEKRSDRSIREMQTIYKCTSELLESFKKVEIFFPVSLSDVILTLRSRVDSIVGIYGQALTIEYLSDLEFNQRYDNFREQIIPAIKKIKEIRVELRALLGFGNESN